MRKQVAAVVLVAALSAPMPVRAAVTCSVSGGPLSFGALVTVGELAAANASAQIELSCAPVAGVGGTIHYTIALLAGGTLNHGSTSMGYRLYSDVARTNSWGDGSGGTSVITGTVTVPNTGPATARHGVYGEAEPNRGLVAGAYIESVVIVVEYVPQ